MLLPQVPRSIFILSFKSRWHCFEDVSGAGEHLTAETDNEESAGLSPASEGCGVTMQAPVSIARLANSNAECFAGGGRVFAQVVRIGSSMICLTLRRPRHSAPLTYPSVKVLMKATIALSSSSLRPRLPSCRVFMFAATYGAGQHEIFSPGSFGAQRRRTSRVL